MGKTRLGGQTVAKAVKATSLTAESATITALTAAVTGDTAGTHTGAVVLPVQVANADGGGRDGTACRTKRICHACQLHA